jgi:hypothetical protein
LRADVPATRVLGVFLLALLAITAPRPGGAAEIDSVTGRAEPLRDSAGAMNDWINARIERGVARANERSEGCQEDVLYAELKRALASPFIGHSIAEELNEKTDLDSRRVLFDDSIYRDLGLFDAISVHWKDLSAVIRVGDHVIGVDKFGHLFVEGWKYFEIAYRDEEGVDAALNWGERSERTYFGHYTTGVYSQADLATNFEGMRFWIRVLRQRPDPLEGTSLFERPHVSCARKLFFGAKRWKRASRVDLERHLGAASDELVNCSSYRNPDIQAMVERRIREREVVDGERYICPIDPDACVAARERYGAYSNRILHPLCLDAEATPQPWWRFWR